MVYKKTSKICFLTFLIISYLISTVHVADAARNLNDHSVAGNLMDCWNAALELKSCTDEIVEFFLNRTGMSEPGTGGGIGKDCCGAIGLIEKECWSVMFTSLGLTNMEGNNLVEYCEEFPAEKKMSELSPVEITYPGLD